MSSSSAKPLRCGTGCPSPVSVPLFEDIPREALKKLRLAHCASTLTLPDTASPNAHGSLIGPAVLTLVRSLRKVGASKPDLSPDDLLPLRTDSVPSLSRSDRRFTESEHDEFFDVTCKRAFLCARFIRWWTECDHSKRNLRDMLNRLPENELLRNVERHVMQSTTDGCISTKLVAQVEEQFAQVQAGDHV